MQMGGSDQWGNITTAAELIRRKAGTDAFAFTCPLMTKADGGKFGKTEKGNVWLDPEKTSPYQFYQFWLNASDVDAEKWIKIFTFISKDEIQQLVESHSQNAGARELQKRLAKDVTIFIHGEEEYHKAVETTEKLFANQSASIESMSVQDLQAMEGVVHFDFDKNRLRQGVDIVSFLAETGIFPSKGEARKMVQNGGLSINRNKITEPAMIVDDKLLLHEQYILVQKGKKNYYLVKST